MLNTQEIFLRLGIQDSSKQVWRFSGWDGWINNRFQPVKNSVELLQGNQAVLPQENVGVTRWLVMLSEDEIDRFGRDGQFGFQILNELSL